MAAVVLLYMEGKNDRDYRTMVNVKFETSFVHLTQVQKFSVMGLLHKIKVVRKLSSEGGRIFSPGPLIKPPSFGTNTDENARLSPARLLPTITDLDQPLALSVVDVEARLFLPHLFYNTICVEIRDMLRMLEGLQLKAKHNSLETVDIATFYEWFEGFFGIVTSIFDAEEDVLFSWLENIDGIRMEHSLAPERRKTKQERAKDLCWDILALKLQFEAESRENKTGSKINLGDLVCEIQDESEQLTTRIITYFKTLVDELPTLLDEKFTVEECKLIETTMINNLKASIVGSFVICACSRGFIDEDMRIEFLQDSLKTPKSLNVISQKHMRKFRKKHMELVDRLAVRELELTSAE